MCSQKSYRRKHDFKEVSDKYVQTDNTIYLTEVEETMLYFIRVFKINIASLSTLCCGVVYNYSSRRYSVATEPIETDSEDDEPRSMDHVDDLTVNKLVEESKKNKELLNNVMYKSDANIFQLIQDQQKNLATTANEVAKKTESIGINTDMSGSYSDIVEVKRKEPNSTPELANDMGDLNFRYTQPLNPRNIILNKWSKDKRSSKKQQGSPVQLLDVQMILPQRKQQEKSLQNQSRALQNPAPPEISPVTAIISPLTNQTQQNQQSPYMPDQIRQVHMEHPVPLVNKVPQTSETFNERPKSVFNPRPGHEYVSPYTRAYYPPLPLDCLRFLAENNVSIEDLTSNPRDENKQTNPTRANLMNNMQKQTLQHSYMQRQLKQNQTRASNENLFDNMHKQTLQNPYIQRQLQQNQKQKQLFQHQQVLQQQQQQVLQQQQQQVLQQQQQQVLQEQQQQVLQQQQQQVLQQQQQQVLQQQQQQHNNDLFQSVVEAVQRPPLNNSLHHCQFHQYRQMQAIPVPLQRSPMQTATQQTHTSATAPNTSSSNSFPYINNINTNVQAVPLRSSTPTPAFPSLDKKYSSSRKMNNSRRSNLRHLRVDHGPSVSDTRIPDAYLPTGPTSQMWPQSLPHRTPRIVSHTDTNESSGTQQYTYPTAQNWLQSTVDSRASFQQTSGWPQNTSSFGTHRPF